MKPETNNGERRLLWKIVSVLCAIALAVLLGMSSWTLCQVVQLKVEVAGLLAGQRHVIERLVRIEKSIDTAGKVAHGH